MKKLTLIILAVVLVSQVFGQGFRTANVVIVTLDGLRWQEVYRGADSALINSKYTDDKSSVQKQFWADDAGERRKMLFPFLWSTLARRGQLYGNRDAGSKDEVANSYFFSYPGYNEIFTGYTDPHMNTNNAISNPNINVLE